MSELSRSEPAGFEERVLLVAFVDLSNYARISGEQTNGEAFAWISEFAERVGRGIEGCGGRVVKFIGDAALITFEAVDARAGVKTLRRLKESIDSWLASLGLASELLVRAHLGSVAVGRIGVEGDQRLDIIGRVVNEAAKLPQGPFVLTRELERAISS